MARQSRINFWFGLSNLTDFLEYCTSNEVEFSGFSYKINSEITNTSWLLELAPFIMYCKNKNPESLEFSNDIIPGSVYGKWVTENTNDNLKIVSDLLPTVEWFKIITSDIVIYDSHGETLKSFVRSFDKLFLRSADKTRLCNDYTLMTNGLYTVSWPTMQKAIQEYMEENG